ncbi:hypothetical protein [Leptospira adleri]|uniref:Uncharacterized protein n=1 Tax=Leptospira adleri TaxID=2023186 RepID=A0A2M9YKK0_9LEPT|nr:hypothetical protein [Leptospira adleri]PJZ52073.1 hypothetical protein CH380_16665 [Leptospira adleri]PJZ62935.1 hypothetical protein CH376_05445 [Leptospira adleri]
MSLGIEITLILFSLVLGIALATRDLYKSNAKGAFSIYLFLSAWFGVVILLATNNVFTPAKHSPIPVGAAVMIPVVLSVIAIYRIPRLKKFLLSISQQNLIEMHIARLVGLIFLFYYFQNRLPGIFSMSAAFGDCLVAISAPFVIWAVNRKKSFAPKVFRFFHLIGLLDFAAAVTLGTLSAEGPQRLIFQSVPSNAIASFPLVLIPAFGVPVIILTHFISLLKFSEAKKTKSDDLFI